MDIVEIIRRIQPKDGEGNPVLGVYNDAANEIERLRAENERVKKAANDFLDWFQGSEMDAPNSAFVLQQIRGYPVPDGWAGCSEQHNELCDAIGRERPGDL